MISNCCFSAPMSLMLISQAQANEVKTVPPVNSVLMQENMDPRPQQSSEFSPNVYFLHVEKFKRSLVGTHGQRVIKFISCLLFVS